ncbi:uncharacterized protein mlphb [Entelurus aequoreus]|uniref:uncharacterized protein mlphb n=1 Tax=Entelurus aequoreus TaxID=161455 RepID=UPI002B1E44E1|nr:uncharacterized protein mlphb [Entelurus aequoreus]
MAAKKLDLSKLTDEEVNHVWNVVQRDFHLRKKEEDRLGDLKSKIWKEDSKRELLCRQTCLSESYCIRCVKSFKFLINSKRRCLDCQLFVCKACSRWNKRQRGFVCDPCHMTRVLKIGTLEWYHENMQARFKHFGSANVMRSLFKRLSGKHTCSSDEDEKLGDYDTQRNPELHTAVGFEDAGMDVIDSQHYHQMKKNRRRLTVNPIDTSDLCDVRSRQFNQVNQTLFAIRWPVFGATSYYVLYCLDWVPTLAGGIFRKSPPLHCCSVASDAGPHAVEGCPLLPGQFLAGDVCGANFHCSLKLVLTQVALEVSADVVLNSSWACMAKGRLDFRRTRRGVSVTILWRRWDSLVCAFRERASGAASCLMFAGAMPARMGSWFTGVPRRHPETVRRALLRATSNFFTWALRHQTGAQYSAAENTRASADMCSVFVVAPHVVPASRRIRAARALVFALALCRCCLNVSVLSSFTPRYVGTGWDCNRALSTMMFISRAASMLLTWNIEDVVLSMLSLRRQHQSSEDFNVDVGSDGGLPSQQEDPVYSDQPSVASRSTSRLSCSTFGSAGVLQNRTFYTLGPDDYECDYDLRQSDAVYSSQEFKHTSQDSLNDPNPHPPQMNELVRRMSAVEMLLNRLQVTLTFHQTSEASQAPDRASSPHEWEEVEMEEHQLRQKLNEMTGDISDRSLSCDEDEAKLQEEAAAQEDTTLTSSRSSIVVCNTQKRNSSIESLKNKSHLPDDESKSNFKGSTALLFELEDKIAQAAADVQNTQTQVSYIENRMTALNSAGLPLDNKLKSGIQTRRLSHNLPTRRNHDTKLGKRRLSLM